MKIKQFFVCSIIYIGVVGIVAFMQESGSYSLNLFGFSLTLPIAVWIALAVAVYAVLAILHLMACGISYYNAKRAISKDLNEYDSMSKEILLGLESNKFFKTEYFKEASEVTKCLSPWGLQGNESSIKNEELKEIFELVKSIKNGEVAELKKFKLPKTNPLFVLNELNKLAKNPKYAFEILKSKAGYSEEFLQKAFEVLLENENYGEIKKYGTASTLNEANIIVNRLNSGNYEISKEDLFEILNNKDFKANDYINFAKKLQKVLPPESLKATFERLSNENAEATDAYWYVLYEIGMIDELREQIGVNDGVENEKFMLLLFLKDNGKNIPASMLF